MKRWIAPLAFAATALACQVDREPNYEFLPWINHMFFSQAAEPFARAPVSAKTGRPVFKNGLVMQAPPDGTLPHVVERRSWPLHLGADEDGRKAAEKLENPYLADQPAHLERGKVAFLTWCAPCHNDNGDGKTKVSLMAGWGFPLTTQKVKDYTDGTIFHLATYGRGDMPSYKTQVGDADRWKIVLYLRQLQKANVQTP